MLTVNDRWVFSFASRTETHRIYMTKTPDFLYTSCTVAHSGSYYYINGSSYNIMYFMYLCRFDELCPPDESAPDVVVRR